MRKVSVLTSLAVLGLSSGLVAAPAVAADDLSYSFIELGYVNAELDDPDIDGDGFALRGSYAFTDLFHGFVEYSDLEFDRGVDSSTFEIGGGLNWELSPRLDLIGTVSYLNTDVDGPGFSGDDSGFGLGLSLRGRVSDQLELRGGLKYVNYDDSGDDTTLGLGARFYVTKLFALGADLDYNDDGLAWMIGGRFDFN
jgi:hypothetical protein